MSAPVEERFVDPIAGTESADLDAFYCRACGRNGRISGAWAMDVLRGAKQRQEA